MTNDCALVTVASWEDRFILGLERLLGQRKVRRVLMYHYKEYARRSLANRNRAEAVCAEFGIPLICHALSFAEYIGSWRKIESTVGVDLGSASNVLLDISTMPREAIWSILSLLGGSVASIAYAYHRPERYSSNWLSRDPGSPRLVFKLSGETILGLPTVLVVLTGFDLDRVMQLMTFFEPQLTLLGLQGGDQFANASANVKLHHDKFAKHSNVSEFQIDAFASDHGLSAVLSQVEEWLPKANIIMSSLGPKLGAIALYQTYQRHPRIALAYAPSNEFNSEYSVGIGETVLGTL